MRTKQLRLNTIKNTKNSLAKVVREYYRNDDELDRSVTWWRVLAQMLSDHVRCIKTEKELDIEKRLEKVEEILRDRVGEI